MRPTFSNRNCSSLHWILSVLAFVSLCIPTLSAAQQSTSKKPEPGTSGGTAGPRTFDSPQQAANVLVDAAEKFDSAVSSLKTASMPPTSRLKLARRRVSL
jgi:hypothetical protein